MPARRGMLCFGRHYRTVGRSLDEAPAIPERLHGIVARAEAYAGMAPGSIDQVIVTRYPAGAGIGAHTAAPVFGTAIVGISLQSSCAMRFTRNGAVVVEELAPRSIYVMAGDCRALWKHAIVRCPRLCYSVTLRTVAKR